MENEMLVTVTLYKAVVAVSLITNLFMPDVREIKTYTLKDRYETTYECYSKINRYLEKIPSAIVYERDVMIEEQTCVEIEFTKEIDIPLPRKKPVRVS
tara:strand:- start:82 stop:375 length:294 start_codon:yes stop_codon:yes gene_type:complete